MLSKLKEYGDHGEKAKRKGNFIKIFLTDGSKKSRQTVLDTLVSDFPGAKMKDDNHGFSSIGYVQLGSLKVTIKPGKAQGAGAPGVGNEMILVNSINKTIRKFGGEAIDVAFWGTRHDFIAWDIIKAVRMGGATAGRAKSDVDLIDVDGGRYKISIKKDDMKWWESVGSYWGKEASKAIDKAVKEGKTELIPLMANGKQKSATGSNARPIYQLSKEIQVKATTKQKNDVVFGNDIKPPKGKFAKAGNGAVIKRTLKSADFVYEDATLWVECSAVILGLNDIRGDASPVFLISNSKGRNAKNINYAGVRATAVGSKWARRAVKVNL